MAEPTAPIQTSLDNNLRELRRLLGWPDDLIVRRFTLALADRPPAAVAYLEGPADEKTIAEDVIGPLTLKAHRLLGAQAPPVRDLSLVERLLIGIPKAVRTLNWAEVLSALPVGSAVVFVDGAGEAFVVDVRHDWSRPIKEPDTTPVIRGPREGFVENLHRNLAMIRRRIATADLTVQILQVGERTRTMVAVVYVDGVAEERTVREVLTRLEKVRIDAVLESGYLEPFLQDHWLTVFPTVRATERVDVVLGNLLEGRVAVVTDGTPFVLLVPTTLNALLQISEDYFTRWPFSVLLRFVRYLSLLIGLTLPGIWVSLVSFNVEMLPPDLAIRVAQGREGIPFPAVVEALIMEVAFEILREAGTRLPRAIGNAISIVGVLVLGEAAVRAGIISPTMIVVVGLTALATFTIPDFSLANGVRIARFGILGLGAVFGFFGVVWGLLAVLVHLLTLRSVGVPYLAPMAPLGFRGLVQDTLLQMPWWAMRTRPLRTARDARRQPVEMPVPPHAGAAEGDGEPP